MLINIRVRSYRRLRLAMLSCIVIAGLLHLSSSGRLAGATMQQKPIGVLTQQKRLGITARQNQIAVVGAAYNGETKITPDSTAAAFGNFKTINNQLYTADTTPLPTTLGGVSVTVNGIPAPLIFTSTFQINFVVLPSIPLGSAEVVVTNSDASTLAGTVPVVQVSPGIFTAKTDGLGVAAGLTTFDNVTYQLTYNPDGSAHEIDPGTRARPNTLILFGTGLRNVSASNPSDGNGVAESVTVTIQGVPATVTYAGPHQTSRGIDQVNITIPPELAGLSDVRLRLVAGGQVANLVTLKLANVVVPLKMMSIEDEGEIDGSLTPDDQVQVAGNGNGRRYFFDAYRFTASEIESVAIEIYSFQFDAAVILYKLNQDGSYTYLGSDDQTSGMDSSRNDNNNALLLTVLPEPGDYVILVTSAETDPEGTGNYELELETKEIKQVSYGANISGAISGDSLQSSLGTYFDAYWFTGKQGDAVQIQVNSANFDAFMLLNSGNGDMIGYDDNSGGELNAQVAKVLPASGNYVLIVTPFERFKTGAYTLTITQIDRGPDSKSVTASGRAWTNARDAAGNSLHYSARRVIAGACC